MNTIKIIDNKVISNGYNDNIYINDYSKSSYLTIDKKSVFIIVASNNDISLVMDCEYNNFEQDIIILIDDNTKLNLFEYKTGLNVKGNITYVLQTNAKLIINKFCDINNVEENIKILLNGTNSSVEYFFSTICNSNKVYNMYINHNNKKTNSNIMVRGVSLKKAILNFNINSDVAESGSESRVNQDSRVIVLDDSTSVISPKLFIYDNSIEARHSAVIGKFNSADLFYLKSRGVSEENAFRLLIKGFLLGVITVPHVKNYEILKNISSYWE